MDRVNYHLERANIDGVIKVSDQEAVEMIYHLKRRDGLFVGPSSGLNLVGAYKLAKHLGPGHSIVSILCDSGERNKSKWFNKEFLEEKGLTPFRYLKDDLSFIEPLSESSFCKKPI